MAEDRKYTETINWLQLYLSEGIGPRLFHQLLESYETVEKILDVFPHLCQDNKYLKNVNIVSRDYAVAEYEKCMSSDVHILLAKDEDFPETLLPLIDTPPVLFLKGKIDLLRLPSVALVGARNSSIHSRQFAAHLAADLGVQDVAVVSGLARGIDTAAHQGAISHGTIAVIANGIDVIYPPENKMLYDSIGRDGLLVSEFPMGTLPKAGFFPRRNRIISGLADIVVVVEAALNSGSLITARYALEQGKDVGAVPASPVDPRSQGTNSLIKQGAFVVENVDDIMALFSFQCSRESTPVSPCKKEMSVDCAIDHNGLQQKILSCLSLVPVDIDALLLEMSIAPKVLLAILLELELAGKVRRCLGNKVVLTT